MYVRAASQARSAHAVGTTRGASRHMHKLDGVMGLPTCTWLCHIVFLAKLDHVYIGRAYRVGAGALAALAALGEVRPRALAGRTGSTCRSSSRASFLHGGAGGARAAPTLVWGCA